MCGIAGIIASPAPRLPDIIRGMTSTLVHRGPDGEGWWCDEARGVALGHRRLAILDLSEAGKQPMCSAHGRFVMVFNGEVYNFADLRRELERRGHRFRGNSDTEVMLAAFEQWGVRDATMRFNGMFAFAVWDRKEQLLHLARDRLGVKPLYYGWNGEAFLFASELKALEAYPGFRRDLNAEALCLYLRRSYVPTPHCIYRNIYKLGHACLLSLADADLRRKPADFSAEAGAPAHVRPERFWTLPPGARRPDPCSAAEGEDVIAEAHELLKEAVRLRMRADVPLGAFLSGGIDSSLVVALMQAQSSEPVNTFSIGFEDRAYNEAPHAQQVAQRLCTRHAALLVSPAEALQTVPLLAAIWDEPFADCSQIPTALLARLTRRSVTVSLSGDGGDELFAGYNRYLWQSCWPRALWRTPRAWRAGVAGALSLLRQEQWDGAFAAVQGWLPASFRLTLPGNKIAKLAQVLASVDAADAYNRLISTWNEPELPLLHPAESPGAPHACPLLAKRHPAERLMYWDLHGYLPDDVMTKVDRASMAAGLEAREPLLDYRLVEFAWQLPLCFKIRGGRTKWILRRILREYLPPALFARPKMGFAVPIDAWLRSELRPWAEELLSPDRLRGDGIFDVRAVRAKWREHCAATHNWQFPLWNVLMLQAWLHRPREVV